MMLRWLRRRQEARQARAGARDYAAFASSARVNSFRGLLRIGTYPNA